MLGGKVPNGSIQAAQKGPRIHSKPKENILNGAMFLAFPPIFPVASVAAKYGRAPLQICFALAPLLLQPAAPKIQSIFASCHVGGGALA